MLASLETPLLREDTAAVVAITVSQLLMQTGNLSIPSPLPAAGDWELSAAESPASASGPARWFSLSHSHSTATARARVLSSPALLPGYAPT